MIGYRDMWELCSAVEGKEVLELMCEVPLDQRINKELLMNTLLMELGGCGAVDDRTQPFMARHKIWFMIMNGNITRMMDAYGIEYDPIGDYHMHETVDRDRDVLEENSGTTGTTTDSTGSNSERVTSSDENKTSAFNEMVYQPKEQNSGSDDKSGSSNLHEVVNGNQRLTNDTKENEDIIRDKRGKIGTTSYQALIKQEMELRKWNVYQWIVKQYKKKNVILVR